MQRIIEGLGDAATDKQLRLMGVSAVAWEVIRWACVKALSRRYPDKVSKELAISVVGTLHALVASALSLRVALFESTTESLYERIPLSQTTFAISAGYFAWDIYYIFLVDSKLDPAFAIHGVACFLCYLFGQYPFLNYYGVYFLLFELSTPFMHLRRGLLLLGLKDSIWFSRTEMAFGLSFLIARIIVGLPMSALVWRDILKLLKTPENVHSLFVAYYYLVANTALCGLNLFWLWGMIAKRITKGKGKKLA